MRLAIWLMTVPFFSGLAADSALPQSATDSTEFTDAKTEVYKSIDQIDLKLRVFEPQNATEGEPHPAIVFFFGGKWKHGTPKQFEPHCRYLASRGMVAITAEYRVFEKHGVTLSKCVSDAKSAIRFVRQHASRLGIDPHRIVAAGGSAGGHLAACTAVVPGLDEPTEDLTISSQPDALALFNPPLVLKPYDNSTGLPTETLADISQRSGVALEKISPVEHIRGDLPPTIIFHGTADSSVPFATAVKYAELAQASGNRCELVGYDGATHGFFNFGRGGTPGEYFLRTLNRLDNFLGSIDYLTGEATIALPDSQHVHLRSGFVNSLTKFREEGKGRVAFIGGSITEMNGYRPMVAQFLSETFPHTEFEFINAGISSTCSTTGAFRLARDVLSANPDLLFVEFAVNDDQDAAHEARECRRGMEGIIRQALIHNPQLDLVVTHFINPPMLELLTRGETPISSREHERVAKHYGVSSVDLAGEIAERIATGGLTWETYGGTHPKPAGNRIAADLIKEMLTAADKTDLGFTSANPPPRLPIPLDDNSYYRGRLVSAEAAKCDEHWSHEVPNWEDLPGQKRSRFLQARMLTADAPGASLEFSFQGTAVGAYLLAGPDAGIVEVSVDGDAYQPVELFHRFSRGLHYPRTVMFATDLEPGVHRLSLRISKRNHPDSRGHAVRIMSFVAN